jgi:hypothetical protein
MKLLNMVLAFGLLAAVTAPLAAQRARPQRATRERAATDSTKLFVPAAARPPRGMCRIWLAGVPAAQQPAATDCPTALKTRPPKARVIFGDDFADSAKARPGGEDALPPGVKGFSGLKTKKPS